jgi:hypothetical protein
VIAGSRHFRVHRRQRRQAGPIAGGRGADGALQLRWKTRLVWSADELAELEAERKRILASVRKEPAQASAAPPKAARDAKPAALVSRLRRSPSALPRAVAEARAASEAGRRPAPPVEAKPPTPAPVEVKTPVPAPLRLRRRLLRSPPAARHRAPRSGSAGRPAALAAPPPAAPPNRPRSLRRSLRRSRRPAAGPRRIRMRRRCCRRSRRQVLRSERQRRARTRVAYRRPRG